MRARVVFLTLAVSLVATGLACKSKAKTSDAAVDEFIAGASAFGSSSGTGTPQSGQPPAPSGGPSATPTGNSNAIDGGSNIYGVSGNAPFNKVLVSVDVPSGGQAALGTGFPSPFVTAGIATGFIEIVLANEVTNIQVLLNFGRDMPTETFTLRFQLVAGGGGVGAVATVPITVLQQAASGDVQISASWDAASDVDLHVVEPNQNEIAWFAPTSSTGGSLDLDSNSACNIDGKNIENISYPPGQAPAGTYTVRLHYFDECGVPQTNFVVTVNNGGSTTVFQGTFTGNGPQDGSGFGGSGRLITTFNKAAGSFTLFEGLAPGGPRRAAPAPSPIKLEIVRRRGGGR